MEPAIYSNDPPDPVAASGRGWGERATVIQILSAVLSKGPWLLGERFTAADVMLGSLLAIALFNKRIAEPPASLNTYSDRLGARSAFKRAAEATWG
jgi:glutathione S-transferase